MRSQADWAMVHRAGRRRARQIVERQDRKFKPSSASDLTPWASDRERIRRRRQIERGQLKAANGLM